MTVTARVCDWCDEPLDGEDPGFFLVDMHHDCLLRAVAGGLNHQRGECSCKGGTLPSDPPSLSRREAARVAAMHYRRTH